jgi:hypothetical protein
MIAKPKSQFGYISEGLGMENVGKFLGQLVYFMVNWYILWAIGIFYGQLVYFGEIGIFYGQLVYFMVNRYILLTIGLIYSRLVYTYCSHLLYFPQFGILSKKNLATLRCSYHFNQSRMHSKLNERFKESQDFFAK